MSFSTKKVVGDQAARSPEARVASGESPAEPVGAVVEPEPEGVVRVRVPRHPLSYPGHLKEDWAEMKGNFHC